MDNVDNVCWCTVTTYVSVHSNSYYPSMLQKQKVAFIFNDFLVNVSFTCGCPIQH